MSDATQQVLVLANAGGVLIRDFAPSAPPPPAVLRPRRIRQLPS